MGTLPAEPNQNPNIWVKIGVCHGMLWLLWCAHRTVTLQRYGGLQDVLLTAMRAEQLDLGQMGQLGSPKLTKLTPSDAAS